MPYSEARERVIVHTPKPNTSYAQASTSRSNSNSHDIVRELLPLLIDALKNNFFPFPIRRLAPPLPGTLPEYPFSHPESQASKRDRNDSSDLVTNENFSESQDNPRMKSKRGWPKSKYDFNQIL
ncbi:hypothetical protein JTB14_006819 [Gonioctena quinquepunctata]|nr:hypothetical protein JTB14_006819 [Gonioctena quinquepunctata]